VRKIIVVVFLINSWLLAQESNLNSIARSIDPYLSEVFTEYFPNENIILRILHFKGGGEHIASEIYFQWIKHNQTGDSIISQKYFKEAGGRLWNMEIIEFTNIDNEIIIEIEAFHLYYGYTKKRNFTIKIDSKGKYNSMDSNFEVKVEE
jgi:hypothetical protein